LSLACAANKHDVARVLLEAKADVNANSRVSSGRPVLHDAIAAGNLKLVKVLLEFGADVLRKSSSRKDALELADMTMLIPQNAAGIRAALAEAARKQKQAAAKRAASAAGAGKPSSGARAGVSSAVESKTGILCAQAMGPLFRLNCSRCPQGLRARGPPASASRR
jgi:hypothetical protein